ncbi:hypothetical protein PQX77_005635 [Marasmius sp. AFHP31]|nr:hypothetical protein PQX77_005635 [Marasmius sp. AFHP31]
MAEVLEAQVVEPHEFAMEDESAIDEDDVVQIGGKGQEMYHVITYPSTFHSWVKKVIDSIPVGRYAVTTSGAKTYAHMTHVGITPPSVTITANDKRLKAGKPALGPFLLTQNDVSCSKIPPRGFVPVLRRVRRCVLPIRERRQRGMVRILWWRI